MDSAGRRFQELGIHADMHDGDQFQVWVFHCEREEKSLLGAIRAETGVNVTDDFGTNRVTFEGTGELMAPRTTH